MVEEGNAQYEWEWDELKHQFHVKPRRGDTVGRIAGPTNFVKNEADPNRQIDKINPDGSDRA